MIRSIAALVVEALSAKASEEDLGAAILAEYERAWAELKSGSKVAATLVFEGDEHLWIASHPEAGATRIASRRFSQARGVG